MRGVPYIPTSIYLFLPCPSPDSGVNPRSSLLREGSPGKGTSTWAAGPSTGSSRRRSRSSGNCPCIWRSRSTRGSGGPRTSSHPVHAPTTADLQNSETNRHESRCLIIYSRSYTVWEHCLRGDVAYSSAREVAIEGDWKPLSSSLSPLLTCEGARKAWRWILPLYSRLEAVMEGCSVDEAQIKSFPIHIQINC